MNRLKAVKHTDAPFTLLLTWDDGSEQIADLSGMIAVSRHFRVFKDNSDAFNAVSVINWGHGIEWENGLDYSAENLAMLTEEESEQPNSAELIAFQKRFNLTNEQSGKALGYKVSQIKNFKSGTSLIPDAVHIAIRAMIRNPVLLYARLADSSG
jgi:hypothetical protein